METMHNQLRIQEISALLPHRYPFLLVDRVLSIEPGLSIKSLKNVTINEPFFQGHFPGEPIMPGVLILEAMAQTGIIFAKNTQPGGFENKLLVFAGMDEVRFRRQVVPGDQLIMELKLLKRKSILWKMEGKTYVNDKVAAEAILLAAVQ
ncbi:MAG: 3-hydroxyacyl-ACP dehydratase FabZ [Dissulfuribacterales bacterium]